MAVMSNMICLLSLLIVGSIQIEKVIGAEELLTVVAVFRHGDRTPTDFAPKDKYQNLTYWPTEPGELTNIGKKEHYELGQWLRKRYNKVLLPETYHKDDIYVRASNTDRCLMSAESNLAGLYPPTGEQIWNKNLKWMPVPIHTVPSAEDNLLKLGKACPKFQPKYKALLSNENFTKLDEDNKKLYDFLTEQLGEPIKKVSDIEAPYDTMTVEVEYKLEQPDWTNTPWGKDKHKVFPDEMKIWADASYLYPTSTSELARLGTGRFFDTVASHFEAVAANQTKNRLANKMVMFFGHKSTLGDLTNTLGTFRLASYASALLFELWKNDKKDTYVKFYYVDDLKPEALTIKGCQENCNFNTFLGLVEPLRMNQTVWEDECLEKNGSAMISGSIIIALMVALALVCDIF